MSDESLDDAGCAELSQLLDVQAALHTKTAKELVDLALENFGDIGHLQDMILFEMCTRIQPGWEKDHDDAIGRQKT